MNTGAVAAAVMSRENYKELLEEQWSDNQDRCCSCHAMNMPPCSFCTDGYSLSCDEYVALALEDYDAALETDEDRDVKAASSDYDRAMDMLK